MRWTAERFKLLTGMTPETFVSDVEGKYPSDELIRYFLSVYRSGKKEKDRKDPRKSVMVIEPGDIYTLKILYDKMRGMKR